MPDGLDLNYELSNLISDAVRVAVILVATKTRVEVADGQSRVG